MTITAEALEKILLNQQDQFEKAQERILEKLTKQLTGASSTPGSDSNSVDAITNGITEFHYEPDAGMIFDSWFKRYEDIFNVELKEKDEHWRVRLLLRKLGTTEHTRYCNFVLPKNARDFGFDATIKQLSEIFGERSSLFNTRYQCMKLVKREAEDFGTYAGGVNLVQALQYD